MNNELAIHDAGSGLKGCKLLKFVNFNLNISLNNYSWLKVSIQFKFDFMFYCSL